MLTVKITVSAIRDGDRASGSIAIDRKKNDTWTRESSSDFVSATPSADRTIVLEDDQRLILEGSSNMEVVYDREQNMATVKEKPAPEPRPQDPDLSAEKSLADQAAEDFAESQRKAAYEKSMAHQAKLAEERKAADATTVKNIQERSVVMTPPSKPSPSPSSLSSSGTSTFGTTESKK